MNDAGGKRIGAGGCALEQHALFGSFCKASRKKKLSAMGMLMRIMILAPAFSAVGAARRTLTPGDVGPRTARTLMQAGDDSWEVWPVQDYNGFSQAAIQAADPNKSIRIIVDYHIYADQRSLNTIIRGLS